MSRITFRRILLRIIFAELAICIGLTSYFAVNQPRPNSSMALAAPITAPRHQATFTQKTVNAGVPLRLKIPKINVDAPLVHVGLNARGDMDTPKDPARAGWYSKGPRPGDSGNAVIDGHSGFKNRQPAVFDNLHKLEAGDSITVVDDKGVSTNFIVRASRIYRPNQDATSVFQAKDGKSYLNLITCRGAWNREQKDYTTRLVVFADKSL